MNVKLSLRPLALHLAGCVIFLALPFLFAPGHSFSFQAIKGAYTQREFFSYLLMIVFFYVNLHIFIPRLYFQRRYGLFVVAVVSSFLIITFLPAIIIPAAGGPGPPPLPHAHARPFAAPPSFMAEVSHNLFLFLVVVFVSLTMQVSGRWRKVEQERTSTELLYLKAQINPHFLFNTLNSIYSLAIERSAKTAEAVVKLSGMMRYVITDAHSDFVPLEKEMDYINNYIDLQRLRLDTTVQLSYTVAGTAAGKKIAPLLLIPFIENAFKYGVNPEKRSDIRIEVTIEKKHLTFVAVNNKVAAKNHVQSGLGIKNARNRLQLLYPAGHRLAIDDTADRFSVSLNLDLT